MANINEILARAASLRDETALNSIDPERAGGIMYDTLLALNELWLQQGAALVISKIYASVAAMNADTSPVSDLTGKPIRPGMIVVIASSDSDNGSVYRYNGTTAPRWSLVGSIGNVAPVDSLDSDSAQLPLAARQGKVLDGKISQLGQYVDNPEWIKVVTDSDDKILYGVKTDGKFYFGGDCPPQVVDYITVKLSELGGDFMVLLSTKVDKILGYSLIDENYASSQSVEENPEWLEVKVDSEDRVLEGIKLDGTRVENVPVETPSSVVKSFSNPEWLKVLTDKDGNILEGITRDGEKEWFKGIPTPILNLLYPVVSGDFHSGMSKEQFVNVYNSKIIAFCKLCRCNPNCMEELKTTDCESVIYEKINHNFRRDVIKNGMTDKIIASQLNKYFRIPIHRFGDIKLNNSDGINDSLIVEPFASYAYEPSALISDDGERIELYNASNSRTTSIDGVRWTAAESLVLSGGRNWAAHTSVNKVDGIYVMIGCAGGGDSDTLDLYTSTDGVHFTWRGHLFQANNTIVAKINGVDTICTGWGNSYLIKDNGTYYLYYECLIRGWEICLATCTDLFVDQGDGFIGNWSQCQGNPIIPRTNIDNDPTKPLKPGNPEIVKGEDNRPLRCNGKYYMYYHAMTGDDKGPIYRAHSEDLVNWVIEGKIFDNRDLPTLPRGTNSDHAMCQFKGRSYLFYTHDINNYEGPNHTADLSAISIREMCDDRPLYELLDLRA